MRHLKGRSNPLAEFGPEIVAEVACATRKHDLRRALFPRLVSESASARMRDLQSRRGIGRVNLPAALKRLVKRRYPDFAFRLSMGDQIHRFEKRSKPVALFLDFQRIGHFGLGKTYEIYLGREAMLGGHVRSWRCNLLSLFDRALLNWTYATSEDLEECLQESSIMLDIALPLFEAAWVAHADRGQDGPSSTPEGRVLTFYDAAEIAYRSIKPFYPQFSHICGADWRRHAAHSSVWTGILSGETWSMSFADKTARRTMRVHVPQRGRLNFGLCEGLSVRRGHVHYWDPGRPYPDERLALPFEPAPSELVDDAPPGRCIGQPGDRAPGREGGRSGFSQAPSGTCL